MKQRPTFDHARVAAVLKLRGHTWGQVARTAGVTQAHLDRVIRGERPGADRVFEAMQEALGSDGCAFATGQTNTLTVSPATETQKT